jgi:hypothetical protein
MKFVRDSVVNIVNGRLYNSCSADLQAVSLGCLLLRRHQRYINREMQRLFEQGRGRGVVLGIPRNVFVGQMTPRQLYRLASNHHGVPPR